MAARWVLVGRVMQTTKLLLKSWSSCSRITGVIRPSLKVHGVGDDRFELDGVRFRHQIRCAQFNTKKPAGE